MVKRDNQFKLNRLLQILKSTSISKMLDDGTACVFQIARNCVTNASSIKAKNQTHLEKSETLLGYDVDMTMTMITSIKHILV